MMGEPEQADGQLVRIVDENVACPALDPGSGAHGLPAWQPIPRRTCGVPVRIHDEELPPCPLCLRRASAGEVQACRAVIDPEGYEDELTEEWERAGLPGGQTVVAFALVRP